MTDDPMTTLTIGGRPAEALSRQIAELSQLLSTPVKTLVEKCNAGEIRVLLFAEVPSIPTSEVDRLILESK